MSTWKSRGLKVTGQAARMARLVMNVVSRMRGMESPSAPTDQPNPSSGQPTHLLNQLQAIHSRVVAIEKGRHRYEEICQGDGQGIPADAGAIARVREEGDEERRCNGKQDGDAQIGKTLPLRRINKASPAQVREMPAWFKP